MLSLFDNIKTISFDCYGTLIDWETGLLDFFRPLLKRHGVALDDDALLELYAYVEQAGENGAFKNYKSVLRSSVHSIGKHLHCMFSEQEADSLAQALGDWPPFPDTIASLKALQSRYQLAIISNTDDDLFAATSRRLNISFEKIITAEQVRSYKPSENNFLRALESIGETPASLLHVAQSRYHDIAPARALGLKTVWVDRRYDKPGGGATAGSDAIPDLAVPSLKALARLMNVL